MFYLILSKTDGSTIYSEPSINVRLQHSITEVQFSEKPNCGSLSSSKKSYIKHPKRWRNLAQKRKELTEKEINQQQLEDIKEAALNDTVFENNYRSNEVILDSSSTINILQNNQRQHSTEYIAECEMPTDAGLFRMRSYKYSSNFQKLEPIVMVVGDNYGKENVLVRVHDQCFTSEVFGSKRCDCRDQLQESLRLIQDNDGIVIYLQQEGRGIGIANKIAAYSLQDQGMDTVEANNHLGFRDELREYYAIPDILKDLGIKSIKLMTNNPYKIDQLTRLGVKITERVPIQINSNPFNRRYLASKRDRMHHFLSDDVISGKDSSNSFLKLRTKKHPVDLDDIDKIDILEASLDCQQEAVNKDSTAVEIPPLEQEEEASEPNSAQIAPPAEKSLINSEDTKVEMNGGYIFGKKSVLAAISDIHNGKIVIVVDDADRENEGDLIMAAEKATPETIGFMVRYTSGVLCVSMESQRLDELNLPPMVVNNEDPKQTAYTVSVDAKHNTTTGISAADRATTFRLLADPNSKIDDFQRPGHVFPLRYKPGGVIKRAGHTEASLDLSRLAGLRPAGVLAEVVNDDGSMTRLPGLELMAKEHGLVLTSVQDIIAYRKEIENI
eukprot:gene9790-13171_t